MASEPDWSKVLLALHDAQASTVVRDDQSFRTYNLYNIAEVTDLNSDQIEDAVQYLDDVGLVNSHELNFPLIEDDADIDPYQLQGGLTTDGFEVAHERQVRQTEQITNRMLVLFTSMLAIAAFLEVTVLIIDPRSDPLVVVTVAIMGILIIITLAYAVYRYNQAISHPLRMDHLGK